MFFENFSSTKNICIFLKLFPHKKKKKKIVKMCHEIFENVFSVERQTENEQINGQRFVKYLKSNMIGTYKYHT